VFIDFFLQPPSFQKQLIQFRFKPKYTNIQNLQYIQIYRYLLVAELFLSLKAVTEKVTSDNVRVPSILKSSIVLIFSGGILWIIIVLILSLSFFIFFFFSSVRSRDIGVLLFSAGRGYWGGLARTMSPLSMECRREELALLNRLTDVANEDLHCLLLSDDDPWCPFPESEWSCWGLVGASLHFLVNHAL